MNNTNNLVSVNVVLDCLQVELFSILIEEAEVETNHGGHMGLEASHNGVTY